MIERRPIMLTRLLEEAGLGHADIIGNPQVMVTSLSVHAQRTARNGLFVALVGTRVDTHMLLGEAVDAGAAVLMVERECMPYPGVTIVRVKNTRQALGYLAQAFHGRPTRAMNVCGITGTNGKTSTAQQLGSILRTAGARVGIIGTLGATFAGRHLDFHTTTPGPLDLASLLAEMEKERVGSVVMEVSSHAIDQGRINGIPFRCGALTNISHDHLDYHGSFENYLLCKRSFFTDYVASTPGSVSVLNLDDALGMELCDSYQGEHLAYSLESSDADIHAENIQFERHLTRFDLLINGSRHGVCTSIAGQYNVANMLAAAGCAYSMGVDPATIAEGLEVAPQVPGRLEFINEGQAFPVIVDYAHTPDALERVLRVARRYTQDRLIVVFGCGGDRDRRKRPVMGRTAGNLADFVIVTNDNPRTEDPDLIASHTLEGILGSSLKSNRYMVELNRADAIMRAIELALPGDTVLIAGKGHEDYQEVGTMRVHFDDREFARECLRAIVAKNTTPLPTDTPLLESHR
ncbi:MAG: UDP-N-acetylmuramoyl-L-alanyl-D-glutamate--2,6-diaminopimelate ligase [Candidatus Sumerlaeia bacterium]|nr:UDP-N-acetylmuramoyl-L-alanyl-D-glutamate--2,6-diaminopimelate ligase [Candidatus Sumerlaeia bacterium]